MKHINMAATVWCQRYAESAESGLNLQGRICRLMFSAVLHGQLKAGMAVPSSRELADYLGVARNTVVIAYQQLVAENILQSQQRRGHFIHPNFQLDCSEPKSLATTSCATAWTHRFKLRPSQQPQLNKPVDWADYPYPFIYGQPDPACFPVTAWRECAVKALSFKDASVWAQDLTQQGDDAYLINSIRQHILPTRGIVAQENEILLTVGSQNALYMLVNLLVDQHSVVGMEQPGYPDIRNMFLMKTQLLHTFSIDHEGMQLPEKIRCDYLYVTPSRQCPTGISMSPQRRQSLLKWAEQQDCIIIEDEYDAPILLHNTTIPALKSQDRHDRVIYVGSLSKPLAPGLRLGYIVASPALINELRHLRRLILRHPNLFIQRVFAFFIDQGYYHSMLRRQQQLHSQRGAVLAQALRQYLPDWKCFPMNGGSACWLYTSEKIDTTLLAQYAAGHGVFIEPGQAFFMNPQQPTQRFLRLGIASIATEKIEMGIQLLAQALFEYKKYNGDLAPHLTSCSRFNGSVAAS